DPRPCRAPSRTSPSRPSSLAPSIPPSVLLGRCFAQTSERAQLNASWRTAGREDLARAALERKTAAQAQLRGLDEQVQGLEAQQQKLVASERQLSAKIEAFRSEKEVIKANYSAAEAQVRIGEAATGIGEQMADTGLAIQRARDKTEEMQARAGAMDELIASGTLEDFTSDKTQLDRELEQISSQSQVDTELARLKGELGAGAERKEIEP
ncbi:MAG: PspA/IM30 family protein, partial [Actinobacteria bacterium]|nr:PspA/IM30 family protein [Actinomycetota bacterium]